MKRNKQDIKTNRRRATRERVHAGRRSKYAKKNDRNPVASDEVQARAAIAKAKDDLGDNIFGPGEFAATDLLLDQFPRMKYHRAKYLVRKILEEVAA